MSVAAKPLLTAEEFARLPDPPDGAKQELVRGEVVTMPPPGFVHDHVQVNITYLVESFNRVHNLGHLTVESGVITETGPDTVRGPDVAFWSYATLPADHVPVVYANVAADLVAEVVSPSNTRKQVARKLREYFVSGTRLVWIVDPEDRTVTVYTKAGEGTVLWEDATVTGGDVLPGFSSPVSEFFRGVAG
jgi:Uma2 family endonuclease